MRTGFLRATLAAAAWACALGVGAAHAAIYTWVDPKGVVTVSNLPPPDGVKVTGVTPELPPKVAAAIEAAREAARQAELQLLSDRIRELEKEVDFERRPEPPPQVVHQVVMQYTPVQYQIDIAPPAYAGSGCDGDWSNCGGFWGSGYYPSGVFIAPPPPPRRPHGVRRDRLFSLEPLFGASRRFTGR
jgi:hypothetical protein